MADFNPFSLKGKTILVTGASSGIGRSVAVTCSKMGAVVYINGRNSERLNETLSLMDGSDNIGIIGDITKEETIQEIVANSPKFDGVVHCAGIGHAKLCKQIKRSDIEFVMGTNFSAPVLLQSELLSKKKLNKNSSVVFISSLGAKAPNIGNAIYCASKGALLSYANCLKLELAPRQIRVNCILPAMVRTGLVYHDGLTEEDLVKDEQYYLFKRYGQPEDIANLAVYLLSDASSWMTGGQIEISGGSPKY